MNRCLTAEKRYINFHKPKGNLEILSEYVIEQDRAKRALAVAVYNHYKRINGKTAEEDGVELPEEQYRDDRTSRFGKGRFWLNTG